MNVAAADSCRRSFPLRGSPPFSGANAACSYLPLQLALRAEGRKGDDSSGKGRFSGRKIPSGRGTGGEIFMRPLAFVKMTGGLRLRLAEKTLNCNASHSRNR